MKKGDVKESDLSDLETLNSDWVSSDEEQEILIYSADNSISIHYDEEDESLNKNEIILYHPRSKQKTLNEG